jgi:predicted short-subunit dehydrogenase-like oxidoreductase (DUF2520 family)
MARRRRGASFSAPRRRDDEEPIVVFVYGAGKLGRALARALRRCGVRTTLRAARKGLSRAIRADIVVLAVRDADLRPLAKRLARDRLVSRHAVVVHVSGAFGAAPLAPVRRMCAGVAQMHPMISFASTRFTPGLARGTVHVQGDPVAAALARRIARALGMTPRTIRGLDAVAYHAAAGLVANGAAALAAMGAKLLEHAGVPTKVAPKMLGPLLRSVADNVEALGVPQALTGPVRRGELAAVKRHLATLQEMLPEAVGLYLASVEAQIALARAIGDAPPEELDAIGRFVRGRHGGARRQAFTNR